MDQQRDVQFLTSFSLKVHIRISVDGRIGVNRTCEYRDAGNLRSRLFQQLQAFPRNLGTWVVSKPGEISARMGKARHKTTLDRMLTTGHDNRNGRSGFLGGTR